MVSILYQWEIEASGQCDKQEKQQRSMEKIELEVKCNSKIEANFPNACNKTWKNIKGNACLIFKEAWKNRIGNKMQQ